VASLEQVLHRFAQGQGANILTITCANPETFAGAAEDPEKYNLLRVRMGGWSEFFVAMYPAHQAQHQRRPLSDAATPK
jgi:pyruvate-formate lyase